eukprot:CAMPEP_0202770902 /NCGR_PEP_ID=MMETSP1388-20130828/39748_1 /ASSEMBLY_ACC=CAM_ASM_000864 /TAXON_ID=37098 /ORGANISM="Isochrysis sp, Strain CCMP1244" /LENGTH=167 /DNA_ID=CAMNT_0049439779 /DNA_START=99 /DNA_END=603 /DNA_ORIENTATION=+
MFGAWMGVGRSEGGSGGDTPLGIVFPDPACPPALPAWQIRSFTFSLVEYRYEGGVASLAGLARGACQPRLRGACGMSERTREGRLSTSLRRSGASLHNDPAAIARDRFRSVGLSSPSVCRQGGTYSGTVPTGRGSRDDSREGTAGIRGVGLASEKSGMALPILHLST